MSWKTFRAGKLWHFVIAFMLALCLVPIGSNPTEALSLDEYFQIDFGPVSLSKDEIHGNEIFYATVNIEATCIQDIPVLVSAAGITARVVGEHTVSGLVETLNSGYSITIRPFPSKTGDTIEINEVVPLQFSDQAQSGDYNVIGEFIRAVVDTQFGGVAVTQYLPPPQLMGSIEYVAPETTTPTANPPPETTPTPEPPETTPTPKPPETTPTPEPSETTPTPEPPERFPWWVLVLSVAVGVLIGWLIINLRKSKTTVR